MVPVHNKSKSNVPVQMTGLLLRSETTAKTKDLPWHFFPQQQPCLSLSSWTSSRWAAHINNWVIHQFHWKKICQHFTSFSSPAPAELRPCLLKVGLIAEWLLSHADSVVLTAIPLYLTVTDSGATSKWWQSKKEEGSTTFGTSGARPVHTLQNSTMLTSSSKFNVTSSLC